ncbi:MAG: pentapeptide repeat-containing protein [Planctomycetota bacterium]|jgi:uncharacterized protein YjbI with pentapeptide repeats
MTEPLNIDSQQLPKSHVENSDLSGSTFRIVTFEGSTFEDILFAGCTIHNAMLAGVKISESYCAGLEIQGNVDDMVINGVPLAELTDAWEKATGKQFPQFE